MSKRLPVVPHDPHPSRFDRLVDMIRHQTLLGSDVLLEPCDVRTLLAGIQALKVRRDGIELRAPKARAQFIVETVCFEHDVTLKELKSRSRSRRLSVARAAVVAELTRQCPQMSTSDIGRLIGKHHTTVLYWQGKYPNRNPSAYNYLVVGAQEAA